MKLPKYSNQHMYRDLRDKIDCTIAKAFEKKTLTQVIGTVDRGEIIAGK